MRRLARFTLLASTLVAPALIGCATDKPPATDSGPAKTDSAGDVPVDNGTPDAGATACQTDADCVPAQCCHPSSCVLASAAPECADTMCTEVCEGGTMDCGQGHCACQSGTCAVVIDKPL